MDWSRGGGGEGGGWGGGGSLNPGPATYFHRGYSHPTPDSSTCRAVVSY